jgi:hypothetical protein
MWKNGTFNEALKALLFGLILLAIGAGIGYKWLSKPVPCNQIWDTIIIHDTIPGDSTPYLVIRYYPRWDTVEIGVPTEHALSPQKIDTAAILADYFSRYYYSDTITDDTSFFAIINDEVTENKILTREYWHRNLRATSINTTIVPARHALPLSAGPYIGYDEKFGIGLQGSYHQTDTRRSYTGAIGTDGVRVGIMWQIRGKP